nr:Synembryn-A [Ipomoea batatas]
MFTFWFATTPPNYDDTREIRRLLVYMPINMQQRRWHMQLLGPILLHNNSLAPTRYGSLTVENVVTGFWSIRLPKYLQVLFSLLLDHNADGQFRPSYENPKEKPQIIGDRAHPGSKVPGYRSSDLNGESKVLTPGARCPVTGLRTLMVGSKVLTPGARCPGYRSSDLNGGSKVLTPGARCPVTGLRTLMVRAKVLTPGARNLNGESKVLTPGARVPGYSDPGESKVLTPGSKVPGYRGLRTLMVRARCSPREQGARLPVFGTLMVRARCSPREHGARLPVFGLNGGSKVLTPGARCPVTGLWTLMVGARCSPMEQGARLPIFGP